MPPYPHSQTPEEAFSQTPEESILTNAGGKALPCVDVEAATRERVHHGIGGGRMKGGAGSPPSSSHRRKAWREVRIGSGGQRRLSWVYGRTGAG
jgi:hypothetical protein